ncbi:MAG: class I SAM-dependent methyltransferase [Polyangiaceae bacterium]|nr:class I SAM-dependent methyltransferase [Polyangiaceae bacterium]
MNLHPSLGSANAAIFEMFIVPQYLSYFGYPLLEMLAPSLDARVCHVQCRTGYPDRAMLDKLPGAHVYGCDGSEHAIEFARAKAMTVAGFMAEYCVVEGTSLPFPAAAFSHALTLHPFVLPTKRKSMLEEMARVVAPRGQALVAMPLRGSFDEVADLLRECALRNESTDLANAVEAAVKLRPTEDLFARELEAVGFEHVQIDVQTHTFRFRSGRGFLEDPITRMIVLPEFAEALAMDDVTGPFAYVRDAIDKYWSDSTFELTVNVGAASGRRKSH